MEKKSNAELIAVIIIISLFAVGIGIMMIHDRLDKKDNNVEEEKKALTDGEALRTGERLWKYALATYWGTDSAWTTKARENKEQCIAELTEIKKKYSSDFEAESCNSDETNCYKMTLDQFVNENTCNDIGRGSSQNYKNTHLVVGTIQENEVIFAAISEYCESSSCQESNETVNTVTKDFIIGKENGEWVIKYFYLPN